MIVEASLKLRINPDEDQLIFFAKTFGCCRVVHNHFIRANQVAYAAGEKYSGYVANCRLLTELKRQPDREWLNEVNAQSLQFATKTTHLAFKRFFEGTSRYPRFHTKHDRQSFKVPQGFWVEPTANPKRALLFIPKLKTGIEVRIHRQLPEQITSVTISKDPSGRYHAAFQYRRDIQPLPRRDNAVGIDLGIKSLVVDSSGNQIANPRLFVSSQSHLAYLQRQRARKQKGSSRDRSLRHRIAVTYERQRFSRLNLAHQTTRRIIDENQVNVMESLSVKNMMANRHLSKAIGDCGWGEIRRQLEYKSRWYERTHIVIDRWFPSSKTCHACKAVVNALPLNLREWDCPSCGQHLDRDVNAAQNIRDEGLRMLAEALAAQTEQVVRSGSGIESDSKEKLEEASVPGAESMNRETRGEIRW